MTQADLSSAFMADLDPYDQYEVSVTMDKAGTCFAGVESYDHHISMTAVLFRFACKPGHKSLSTSEQRCKIA